MSARAFLPMLAAVFPALPTAGTAQDLAAQMASVSEGTVRFSYPVREGVCGQGEGYTIATERSSGDWEAACEAGPARVRIELRDGKVGEIKTFVGGRWRPTARGRDLGQVSPREAVALLMSIARDASNPAGHEAIFPATIAADVEVWPGLLDLARASDLPRKTRRQSVFWLGQEAAREAGAGLENLVRTESEDLDLRSHAIFALSQRSDDQAIPSLIRVVEGDTHPELRSRALFWLAQSEDTRVLDLFEKILNGS